jgi:uncharacterized protein (TIGR02246 family)
MERRLIALAAALASAGCAAGAADQRTGSAPVSVATTRAAFVDAYRRGDPDAVAAFYAPDATYIGTAGDVVTGRENLLLGLRREVPAFGDFRIEPSRFEAEGRLAWERGRYSATLRIPGRADQPVSGPYLIVYERGQDGTWLIKAHMSGRER